MRNKITTKRKIRDFNPHTFLSTTGRGRDMLSYEKKDIIFGQGDKTGGIYFVQKGKVRLIVVSDAGKEASWPRDFCVPVKISRELLAGEFTFCDASHGHKANHSVGVLKDQSGRAVVDDCAHEMAVRFGDASANRCLVVA